MEKLLGQASLLNPKFLLYFLLLFPLRCHGRDTITLGNPVLDRLNDTLVSESKRFKLGFFTPDGASDPRRRYLGIWDYGYEPKWVVWVANQEGPILDRSGQFGITGNGNLVVSSKGNASLWSSTSIAGSSTNLSRILVRLMDSGNLVVVEEGSSNNILWESFVHGETDTFLPGMLIESNSKLTSWKGPSDPSKGNFTFQQDKSRSDQYEIRNPLPYWKSGTYQDTCTTNDMPKVLNNLLTKSFSKDTNRSGRTLGPTSEDVPWPSNWNNSRVRIGFNGEVQYFSRENETAEFELVWSEPRDFCGLFNPCGAFGTCNNRSIVPCKCLPGFEQRILYGCTRKSNYKDEFMTLKMMRAGKPDDDGTEAADDEECMNQCIQIHKCQAYSFIPDQNQQRELGGKCWMWYEDLNNMQEDIVQGLDLNVKIAIDDIKPLKSKSCGTCGSNIIPYPLSITDNDCGNPSYSFLICIHSTGRLFFGTPTNNYRVLRVDEQTRNFTIHVKNSTNCRIGLSNISTSINAYPQLYIRNCTTSNDPWTGESLTEVEIGWNLPEAEPPCNKSSDCFDWPQTNCSKAVDGSRRCLCFPNLSWNSTVLNCTEGKANSIQPYGGRAPSHGKKLLYLISLVAVPIIIVAVCCFYSKRRKKSSTRQVKGKQIPWDLETRLYDSERRVKEWISSGQFGEDDKRDIDVPFFDLEVILEATANFSHENKLGQGGFGPVYKGRFPGGQEIAVKRLLSGSGQGLEEFKNEVMLIAKLQHRNLVRLLGYCVEGDEKILLYEYMPNKSLDSFLFDRSRCSVLTWEMRLEIILGIARGMLYLHQDSRLRIIHRDLKTSNVLLDDEMNPKISDFGLARIFEGKQTEASTQRVIGTYGYMAPEYALDGFFSFKSDVFSFGVVVLEIISGKRSTGIYQPEGQVNLLNHAWSLWTEHNAMDMVDPMLLETCNKDEAFKCMNVALLCVQEDPNDRPTMSNVLFMLGGEIATLLTPKKPAFALKPSLSSTGSSSGLELHSISTTLECGR